MTPELWQRAKELYEQALELHPRERAVFLQNACGDEILRAEVESLIAEEARIGEFLGTPTIRLDEDLSGKMLKQYEVLEKLGEGGMGVVYKARDTHLDRFVALKILPAHMMADPALKRQFVREAKSASALNHPNIITVHDVAHENGIDFIVMEYVSGKTLGQLIRPPALPLKRIVNYMVQIADALAKAHSAGIVHRDLKPHNVMVTDQGLVKVLDFGIAKLMKDSDRARHAAKSASSAERIPAESTTETIWPLGTIRAGTPGYMAPEQILGLPVDSRADQFSIGCLFYEMLTGQQPFSGKTTADSMEKTLHYSPPAPSLIKDDLPRSLDRLILRLMRKNPDERYESVSVLVRDLQNYELYECLTDQAHGVRQIIDAMEARQCVLLIGLHLPAARSEGGPTTSDELIAAHLAEHLEIPHGSPSLSRVAQDLQMEASRTEMIRYLSSAIRSPGSYHSQEVLRQVARLPFHVVVTTRYDTFLEEELARIGKSPRRADCHKVPDDTSGGNLLVPLFGSIEEPESLAVTEDDIWEFFAAFHSISDSLKSLFAQQVLLFVGYHPEDEEFRHLLSEIMRFRAGASTDCYLIVANATLPVVRWSKNKGLRLIEAPTAEFLSLLEAGLIERREQNAAPVPQLDQTALPSRPYKFLNYFDSSDTAIFFGRKVETQRLASKIHAYPLNLFYAPSGAGKTSLICAGITPLLQQEGYVPIVVRVYDDPVGEIRRASVETCGKAADGLAHDLPLSELLPQLALRVGKRLAIFVDQFEEIFIRHDSVARHRFVETLQATLVQGKGHVRFVLCLREDFLARLSEFRDQIPTIFHNEFRLESLSLEAAREAITEPAKLLGLEVEPALVERLIADLSHEGIEPPQLQIVCDTLYDKLEPGQKRLTLKSYEALGETRKILGNYMERALREFAAEEREPARAILKWLVTSENTKTVSRLADLARMAGRSEEDASRILADLSNRRLIRRVQREEGYWYELTHEYLVEEISRWLSQKEMELKKLRELLEQAMRNHRNLGILMPAAQLRLVQAQEDDLNLSKEERQFLRESAQALSTRRRRIATGATVAAALLIAAIVTARYLYLRSNAFIEPEDREFIAYPASGASSGKRAYRLEGIRLYSGSANRWWIDRPLGFPRELYQTDFDLDQIEPAKRDRLKAGIMLRRGAPIEEQIFGLLQPDAQVRFLAASGSLDEAVKLLQALYKDRSVDPGSLDDLAGLIAYSGAPKGGWVSDAIRHMFRPGGFVDPFTPKELNLVPVLADISEPEWRPQILPYISSPVSRLGALALFGAMGSLDDVALIKPFLARPSGEALIANEQERALWALLAVNDCSSVDAVGQALDKDEVQSFATSFAVEYLIGCGGRAEMGILERAAKRHSSDASIMIEAMYRIGGRAAIPAIKQILGSMPPSAGKTAAVQSIFEPEMDSELRLELRDPPAVRARAAYALARRGDAAGLEIAAQIASDRGQQIYTRVSALQAFQRFRGSAIERYLLDMARGTTADEPEVRAAVYEALRWYSDPEALRLLVEGLGAQHEAVRNAAQASLVSGGSNARDFLTATLRSLDPVRKVYVAGALQRMNSGSYQEIFKQFLRNESDTLKDYAATVEAILGLRDTYIRQPAVASIEALADGRHDVRLAATLALTAHENPQATRDLLVKAVARQDSHLRMAAARALWALTVAQKARTRETEAESLFSKGNSGDAERMLHLLGRTSRTGLFGSLFFQGLDYPSVLKAGLSISKSSKAQSGVTTYTTASYVFDSAFSLPEDRLDRLVCAIYVATGDVGAALGSVNQLVSSHPGLRKFLAEDQDLKSLRNNYEFRVLTGLQQPTEIDNLKLPEASRSSP